jgi:hypothetical protein
MKKNLTLCIIIFLALVSLFQPGSSVFADTIPATGPQSENYIPASASISALSPFVKSVATTGNPDQAAGIFARDLFAAPIVQQPASAPAYVATAANQATQFSMAAQYGSIALLAHNYLLGEQFFNIQPGKILSLVYGDGHIQNFRVQEVLEYQALSPNSPYSDFVDLNANIRLSVTDLFYKVYAQKGKLVLQTCIEANGDPSWGRLFIIAEPVEIVTPLYTYYGNKSVMMR